ncbi:MAG: hypothetical protein ACKO37_04835 [Vampirovibrionales bacterium]
MSFQITPPQYPLAHTLFHRVPQRVNALKAHHLEAAQKLAGTTGRKVMNVVYDTVIIPTTTSDPIHDIKLGSRYFKTLPAGATITAILVGAIGGRSLFAWLRAPLNPADETHPKPRKDLSELWDVLRRDTVALSMMLFTLDPLCDRVMIPTLEKLKHLRLTHPVTKAPFAFTALQDIYALRTPALLHAFLVDKSDHHRAFDHAMRQGLARVQLQRASAPDTVKKVLATLEAQWHETQATLHVYHGLKGYQQGKLSKELLLSGLSPDHLACYRQASDLAAFQQEIHQALQIQVKRLYAQLLALDPVLKAHGLPEVMPQTWVSQYARRSMAPAYLGAIALSTLLVGVAPVWLNKLLGERQTQARPIT